MFKRRPQFRRPGQQRSTPAGQHRPVLLQAVLECLCGPFQATWLSTALVGWAGHSSEFLKLVTPGGRLIGCDLDPENLPRANERLEAVGGDFQLHHSNFAGLATIVAKAGTAGANVVLADLGMSSMQVDDPLRGFSYSARRPTRYAHGPHPRPDGRTDSCKHFSRRVEPGSAHDFSDEPEAEPPGSKRWWRHEKPNRCSPRPIWPSSCKRVSGQENYRLHPTPGKWILHPAAQNVPGLENSRQSRAREPGTSAAYSSHDSCAGGRAGIISFHSGEDRLVKAAFQEGLRARRLHSGGARSDSTRPS